MACKRSSVQVRYPPLFVTRQRTAVYEFFLVLALQARDEGQLNHSHEIMRFWRNEWVAGHYQAVRTELIIAAKCSVHRSISGHCFSFALAECVTFGGARVFCCDGAIATTAVRSGESALIPRPSTKLGRRVPKAG